MSATAITLERRPFAELGGFRNEWLNAHHHFSFGHYHDPRRMGFGALRVWNDDEIAPHTGFDPHPHRDMEIVTYVRQGAITHQDSLGNEGRTEAGDVQVMHAGSGIVHAEYNREDTATRLFQIWIVPGQRGVTPGWGARQFPRDAGRLSILASGRPLDRDSGALPLFANAALAAGRLTTGQSVDWTLAPGRAAYLVAATGRVEVNGIRLDTRDGLAAHGMDRLSISALGEASELVLVDVGME